MISISLNYSEIVQNFFLKTIYEKRVEVSKISEPYRNNKDDAWAQDVNAKAAAWVNGNQAIQEVLEFPEVGFFRPKIAGIYI